MSVSFSLELLLFLVGGLTDILEEEERTRSAKFEIGICSKLTCGGVDVNVNESLR